MIKINTTQKTMQVHLGDGARHRPNGVHFSAKGAYPAAGDRVPKEGHGAHAEDALVAVNGKAGGAEPLEKLPDMLDMHSHTWTGHQDVVQIDKKERQATKYTVHQPLESLGGVF